MRAASVYNCLKVLGWVVLGASSLLAQAKGDPRLPEGNAKDIISAKCQFCHNNDRVIAARMPKEGWVESMDRMIDLGAPIGYTEADILVAYLSGNFGMAGPKTASAPSSSPLPVTLLIANPERAAFVPLASAPAAAEIQISAISGDSSKTGAFSLLLKLPAGGTLPTSWLTSIKTIACLRGSVQFTEGELLNGSSQRLKEGGVVHLAGMRKRSIVSPAGSILLIVGEGPLRF